MGGEFHERLVVKMWKRTMLELESSDEEGVRTRAIIIDYIPFRHGLPGCWFSENEKETKEKRKTEGRDGTGDLVRGG